jgi:hypothetical protein
VKTIKFNIPQKVSQKQQPKTKISFRNPTTGLDQSAKSYLAMVKDPFSEAALGAHLPDPWCFPTAAFHMQNEIIFTTTSTAATQTQEMVFWPHPLISAIDSNGLNGYSTSLQSANGYKPVIQNQYIYSQSTLNLLGSMMNTWRVVGGGIRVSMICPEAVRTGRIFFAPVPGIQTPGWNAINASAMLTDGTASAPFTYFGNNNSYSGSSLLEIPGAFSVTANQLAETAIVLRFKPHSDIVTGFKNATNTAKFSATYNWGDENLVTTAGVVASNDLQQVTDLTGWNGWIVYWEGAPANQTYMQIQQILHLEGEPVINLQQPNSGTQPIPSNNSLIRKNLGAFGRVYQALSNIPLEYYESLARNINNIYNLASGGLPKI